MRNFVRRVPLGGLLFLMLFIGLAVSAGALTESDDSLLGSGNHPAPSAPTHPFEKKTTSPAKPKAKKQPVKKTPPKKTKKPKQKPAH